MKINYDKIGLTFEDAENDLYAGGKELTLFKIAGEDKVFFPAEDNW